jgi:hypothetical protein
MKKVFFKRLFVLTIVIFTTGCTFQTKHRGYVFPENLESEIRGVKTTAQLQDKIGSPQVKTINGDSVWIYYGADENYHGPFPMTYDNKTALLVWTDGSGGIKNIKIMGDSDFPKTEIADGETKIPAAIELNALQELFNNIGRFSPAGLGQ